MRRKYLRIKRKTLSKCLFFVASNVCTLYICNFLIYSIISVKAKSFADREIRYTLKAQGQGAGTFNIGPTSGIVKLAKELDFEDLRQPHVYSLVVTATEDSGGFSTSVEVNIVFVFYSDFRLSLNFHSDWANFLSLTHLPLTFGSWARCNLNAVDVKIQLKLKWNLISQSEQT